MKGKGKVGDFVKKHKKKVIAGATLLAVPVASGVAGLVARHYDQKGHGKKLDKLKKAAKVAVPAVAALAAAAYAVHRHGRVHDLPADDAWNITPGFHEMYKQEGWGKKKRGGGPKIEKAKKLIKKYAAPAAAAAALAWGVKNAYDDKYNHTRVVLPGHEKFAEYYRNSVRGGGKGKFSTMPVKPKPIGMGKRKKGGIVASMEDVVDPNTGLVTKRIKKRGKWDVAY